jgi:hypothetical protein
VSIQEKGPELSGPHGQFMPLLSFNPRRGFPTSAHCSRVGLEKFYVLQLRSLLLSVSFSGQDDPDEQLDWTLTRTAIDEGSAFSSLLRGMASDFVVHG